MKYLVWNKKENRAATPYELEKLHDTNDQQIFASWETHPQVFNEGVVEINLEYSSEGEFEIRAVEEINNESAALPLHGVIGRFSEKSLDNITDQECYEIAVLDGWKTLWEGDRGGNGTVEDAELIQRGRDIVNGEIGGRWIHSDRINGYLFAKGYEALNAL